MTSPVIDIGNIKFAGCPIPLVVEDRYFAIESIRGQDMVSVFVFHGFQPVFEIYRNSPCDNQYTSAVASKAGIITVSDNVNGHFLYKIRPKGKRSVIFGTVWNKGIKVDVKDTGIVVGNLRIPKGAISGDIGVVINTRGIFLGGGLPEKARAILVKTQAGWGPTGQVVVRPLSINCEKCGYEYARFVIEAAKQSGQIKMSLQVHPPQMTLRIIDKSSGSINIVCHKCGHSTPSQLAIFQGF